MLSFRTRAGASAASHHSATPARKAYGSPSAGSLTHVRKCPRMSESPQTIPVRQTSPSPCLIQNDTPLYIFARSTSRPDQSHSNPFQTHQNPRHTLKNHDLGFPPADESNPFLPSILYLLPSFLSLRAGSLNPLRIPSTSSQSWTAPSHTQRIEVNHVPHHHPQRLLFPLALREPRRPLPLLRRHRQCRFQQRWADHRRRLCRYRCRRRRCGCFRAPGLGLVG